MAVFKRKGKDRGLKGQSRSYYGWVRGPDGKRHLVKLASSRRTSLRLLANHQRQALLSNLPQQPSYRNPLDHLSSYGGDLSQRGRTSAHITKTLTRARTVLEGCRPAVSPQAIQQVLTDLSQELSPTTVNHYLKAARAFFNWLVKRQLWPNNPANAISPQPTIKTVKRRALTIEEASRLVSAVLKSSPLMGLTGLQRAVVYLVALSTGLRAGEMRQLDWDNLTLSAQPLVFLPAGLAKNRRAALLPLQQEVAQLLKRLGGPKPFPLPEKTAEMVRRDCRLAGVTIETDDGRLDFHALRHTFITWLVERGHHPAVVQALARHSTISLTMDHYTHLSQDLLRRALDGHQTGQLIRTASHEKDISNPNRQD